MPSSNTTPSIAALRKLNVKQLCRDEKSLTANVALNEMPRLKDSLYEVKGDEPFKLQIEGFEDTQRTGKREQRLQLKTSGEATLQCQRCLEKLRVRLNSTASFVLVASEAEADAMEALNAQLEENDDDGEEANNEPPEPLVVTGTTDVIALLEDELLLSLPIVPMHDTCPAPLQHVNDAADDSAKHETADDGETKTQKPNPFAVLAALKRKPDDKPH